MTLCFKEAAQQAVTQLFSRGQWLRCYSDEKEFSGILPK